MVADLCHFVLSCFWGEKAKRCHAKTRQIVTFSCFRMATFRPATQKYATFHALRFRLLFLASLPYGGCFVPCRINVFSGRKREKSPRENPLNSDFGGISHGDLSPRQAKIRQTVAENATRGMSRTFVWRGERSPCENTIKSSFGGFSRGDLSRFRPCLSYLCLAPGKDTTNRRRKGDA